MHNWLQKLYSNPFKINPWKIVKLVFFQKQWLLSGFKPNKNSIWKAITSEPICPSKQHCLTHLLHKHQIPLSEKSFQSYSHLTACAWHPSAPKAGKFSLWLQATNCLLEESRLFFALFLKRLRANHGLNGFSSKEEQIFYSLLAQSASGLPSCTKKLVPIHSSRENRGLSTAKALKCSCKIASQHAYRKSTSEKGEAVKESHKTNTAHPSRKGASW